MNNDIGIYLAISISSKLAMSNYLAFNTKQHFVAFVMQSITTSLKKNLIVKHSATGKSKFWEGRGCNFLAWLWVEQWARAKPLRGGAAYVSHNDECQSMMRPLCEEKIGESAVGTEGTLKVRVADVLQLCAV